MHIFFSVNLCTVNSCSTKIGRHLQGCNIGSDKLRKHSDWDRFDLIVVEGPAKKGEKKNDECMQNAIV